MTKPFGCDLVGWRRPGECHGGGHHQWHRHADGRFSARRGSIAPLTITSTGVVAPTAYGTDGIVDPATVHNGRIDNLGNVSGAYGGSYTGLNGGIGIDFARQGAP